MSTRKTTRISPAAEAKVREIIDQDATDWDRLAKIEPTGPRDPNFDRAKALEQLSRWYATTVSLLTQLTDSTQDLAQKVQDSPDLFELVSAPHLIQLSQRLEAATSNVYGCYPRLINIPAIE